MRSTGWQSVAHAQRRPPTERYETSLRKRIIRIVKEAAGVRGRPSSARQLIDFAEVPGGGRLDLMQQGQEFEILLDEEQLMGNWATCSERALASVVCAKLGAKAERLLIGGLGMGYTLAAALEAAPSHATIVVAELVPKIVDWAKGPLAHIFGASLDDPRVALRICDVHDIIIGENASLDAILLDVDNGPDRLVSLANERLYSNWGLRAAYAALRPHGVLAVWSAYPDPDFVERLKRAGFMIDEVEVDAGDPKDKFHHIIWLAIKPA